MRRLGATLAAAAVLAIGVSAPATAHDTKIVGGQPTTIASFPWQAAVAASHNFYAGDGYDRQFCGGTLVAPTIVITAAHCTFNFPVPAVGFNNPNRLEVFTGRTTLSSNEGQAIDVAELYYFEGTPSSPVLQARTTDASPATGQLYNPATGEWDAVFLRLAQPSTTGTPIKIAGPGEEGTWAAGQPALISGWGTLSEGGSAPDQLFGATVPMVADSTCAGAYGADFFASTMVCAGFPQGGVDTCQGDSGGPLVVQAFQRSAKAANTVRLVGDTSFGVGCARPGIPGVYGRLAADPMRSAFRNGILQVAGIDVVGSGALAPDSTGPVVDITKHPKKRGTKNKAKFRFTANEEATFTCALDRGAFKPCSSPFKKNVSDKKHKFRVQATDVQGNVGAVDKFKWRVFG
jgi:secreted trypsin-like serine protease